MRGAWAGTLILVVAAAAGCRQSASPDGGAPGANASAMLTPASAEPQELAEPLLYPSRRCGECHGRQKDEWAASAHARAATGAYLVALEATPAERRASCAGCHVPLESAGPRVAADGVGCDACHTAVGPGVPPAAVKLAPETATRFGPFHDSRDHAFHRSEFSAFVTGSGLCAACHQDPPGAPLPVYTTVAEWRAQRDRAECQSCHMPSIREVAATGEKERAVSRHDFLGDRQESLAAAIQLRVLRGGADGGVEGDAGAGPGAGELVVEVENTGAAHALPTGRPERRLRLEVAWLDARGREVGLEEHQFGRRLVDAAGALAPSFRAVREAGDERLAPGHPHRAPLRPVPGARSVRVRLYYDRFDRALAGSFEPVDPLLVTERREPLR